MSFVQPLAAVGIRRCDMGVSFLVRDADDGGEVALPSTERRRGDTLPLTELANQQAHPSCGGGCLVGLRVYREGWCTSVMAIVGGSRSAVWSGSDSICAARAGWWM